MSSPVAVRWLQTLCLLLAISAAAQPVAAGAPVTTASPPPRLAVHSAVLIDSRGEVLYAQRPRRPEPPASLTKMMTADLSLDALTEGRIALADRVPVSDRAYALAKDPALSRMFLQPTLPVTVEQLLSGLMVSSADDAATALAEYLAQGSGAAFVQRMNAHARELGLRHTRFGDPAGLSRMASTDALDMARLALHLLQTHPEILRYSSARYFTYNRIRQPNYNTLLFEDPRVDGLKTGSLHGEYHLLATGKLGEVRLIAVVMGATSHRQRADEAERLLDWGFRTFAAQPPPVDAGTPATDPLAQQEGPLTSEPVTP